MITHVIRDGRCLPVEELIAPPKSGVFYAISDTMDAVAHPITGKLMDSKSQFRRITRAHGCVEVGNETMRPEAQTYDRNELKRDIAHAMSNPDRRPAEHASRYIEGYD